MRPLQDTWVNIRDIVIPKQQIIPSATAAHFHFCHIRPTIAQTRVYKGVIVNLQSEDVAVIVASVSDRYLLATRQGKAPNFSAADADKFRSNFKWFELPHRDLFDGAWQVYYFKPNLLKVP